MFGATIGILSLLAPASQVCAEDVGFRMINVPKEEHGYHHFESEVIDSQEKFDSFVKQIEAQEHWNDKDVFLKIISEAKVDFTKEALVLIRQTEGTGSTRVNFSGCRLNTEKLVCRIQRIPPSGAGLAVMAYYCFGLVVEKDKVKRVEVWAHKADKQVLEIN